MRRRTRRTLFLALIVAVGAAGALGGWLWWRTVKPESVQAESVRVSTAQAADAQVSGTQIGDKTVRSKASKAAAAIQVSEPVFTAEERQQLQSLQQALDNEDCTKVLSLAKDLALCANREVRAKLPEALGWFGPKALVQLTNLLFDPDKEIAAAAIEQWKHALNQLEEANLKAQVMEAGLLAIDDEEALGDLMMELNDLSNSQQMAILLKLLEQGDNLPAQNAAKDQYLFLTGDDYSGTKAAESWLKENPDEE